MILIRKLGGVTFRIGEGASASDVFATIDYLTPDENEQQDSRFRLLRGVVEGTNRLANTRIAMPEVGIDGGANVITLSENSTMQYVERALRVIYGNEYPGKLDVLLGVVIDSGYLQGCSVVCDQRNEFITSTDETIAAEMRIMTAEVKDLDAKGPDSGENNPDPF